jgi:hypothetical protein
MLSPGHDQRLPRKRLSPSLSRPIKEGNELVKDDRSVALRRHIGSD